MKKRSRSLIAVLMVFGLGLGITTALVIAATRTIAAVDYMGLA
jgi:hypothetical protein